MNNPLKIRWGKLVDVRPPGADDFHKQLWGYVNGEPYYHIDKYNDGRVKLSWLAGDGSRDYIYHGTVSFAKSHADRIEAGLSDA